MGKVLERTTFETNREIEFFTEKELSMQIGHGKDWWPAAILKELVDNALDACETAGIAPSIEVAIDDESITVQDNGPGMPEKTLIKSLNYLKRVSDKTYYVSPTRGQLGNALKTVYAAPFVLSGDYGKIEIEAGGCRHTIEVSLDRIEQRPKIEHTKTGCDVRTGSVVRVEMPNSARLLGDPQNVDSYNDDPFQRLVVSGLPDAKELLEGYGAFNPHAEIVYKDLVFERTEAEWRKWRPNDPTSAHWYSEETLRDLIAAYIADERYNGKARTVREFVSEFRGCSSTIKQKEITHDFSGTYLHDLIEDDDVNIEVVRGLLVAMQMKTTAPKPHALGLVGEEHIKRWMVQYAGVAEGSFVYVKRQGLNALPHIVEVGFGVREDDEAGRRIITGLNWAPTLGIPAQEIQDIIGSSRVDRSDPVTLLVHMARPRFDFTDRGKTRLQL